MILCDDNYGLGTYGMDSVHNIEPERSRVTIKYLIKYVNIFLHFDFFFTENCKTNYTTMHDN